MPKRIRSVLLGSALAGISLVVATVAFADHSWSNYHWPSDHLAPTVYTSNAPDSVFNVPAAVQEWADLSTPLQPVSVAGNSGDVEVVVKGMSAFYLGLARIWVDEAGHIQRGRVELNQAYLNSLTAAEWDHVLCQELGHIWGLDHNEDGAAGGTPDNTCMNGAEHLGEYTSPNSHDADELNDKYAHVDAPPPDGGGGGGGNCPPGNPNHRNCLGAEGRWVTVHVFRAP